MRSRLSLVIATLGTALLVMAVGVIPAGAATSPASPVSFSAQGTSTWKVPDGVTRVRISASGAKGSDTPVQSFFRSTGGAGARVTATLDVTPGTTLQINVGVGGGTSQFGGNGGGAADVRVVPSGLLNRVVVAGGGGGAGADSSQCGTPGAGGSGGGGAGAPGPAQHADCSPGGGGGAGGTDTGGGRGGDAFYVFDHHSGDGSFGVGGTALGDDASDAVGGGGGGGWYGGGAGAGLYQSFAGSGGGGGGGSNHVVAGARDVVVASGVNTGAARVTITPLATPTVSFTTSYSKPEADRLHAFATRTHRSDAQAQHDAALSLARLLDAFVRAHPDQTRGSRSMDRGDWLAFAFGRHATVGVTSTYSVQDGAVVTRVSRLLWLSESSFQRFAVAVISRIPPG